MWVRRLASHPTPIASATSATISADARTVARQRREPDDWRRSATEELEHGEHAAVILLGWRKS